MIDRNGLKLIPKLDQPNPPRPGPSYCTPPCVTRDTGKSTFAIESNKHKMWEELFVFFFFFSFNPYLNTVPPLMLFALGTSLAFIPLWQLTVEVFDQLFQFCIFWDQIFNHVGGTLSVKCALFFRGNIPHHPVACRSHWGIFFFFLCQRV